MEDSITVLHSPFGFNLPIVFLSSLVILSSFELNSECLTIPATVLSSLRGCYYWPNLCSLILSGFLFSAALVIRLFLSAADTIIIILPVPSSHISQSVITSSSSSFPSVFFNLPLHLGDLISFPVTCLIVGLLFYLFIPTILLFLLFLSLFYSSCFSSFCFSSRTSDSTESSCLYSLPYSVEPDYYRPTCSPLFV